uniref:Sperm associated antigen 1 n=1 Tax=Stegastes partitus TaxID=144197 RepID=A0A3B5AFV0_9TELE
MSAEAIFSSQSQPTTVDCGGKVPVEHLDYDYIEKCKDVKYLEKILGVLRSGDMGIYPHLISFCESHLEKLDPRSRTLRKESPVATAASLSKEEWSQIVDELKVQIENMAPVRGSSCFVPLSQVKITLNHAQFITIFHSISRFDVEKQCEKIDENVISTDPPTIINTGNPKIKTKVDVSMLQQQEKVLLANREKDKGNEAFRANDYEEAVAYYSRSLSIIPTVAAYNNRAQAQINLKHWHSAMTDCQRVLELEPGNMKALLRRATVYNHMGNFQMATEDLRMVLREEPQNTAATKLLSQIENKLSECQPEQQRKGKKILIQEVEEEDDNSNDKTKAQQTGEIVLVPTQSIAIFLIYRHGDYKQANDHL